MNALWFGYQSHFVEKMLSLRLSMFEKLLFAALMLVLAVNVSDAVQRGDIQAAQPAFQQDLMALQNGNAR
jgi:hypothetical protein